MPMVTLLSMFLIDALRWYRILKLQNSFLVGDSSLLRYAFCFPSLLIPAAVVLNGFSSFYNLLSLDIILRMHVIKLECYNFFGFSD